MDSLSKNLYSVVSQAIDEFAQLVVDNKYDTKEEVLALWNNNVSAELKVEAKPKEEKKSAPRVRSAPAAKTTDSSSLAVCAYLFKKGKNEGTKCLAKVCEESPNFCRKHKSQEGKEATAPVTKEKKSTTSKATSGTSKAKKIAAESKEKDSSAVKKLNDGKPSYVLKKNDQGNYEHPETHLVFDRVLKEVYGKQSDKEILPLTAEDIEMCKKLNFKCRIPTNITSNTESKDEEEEEDVEVEEDEEEEEEEEDEEEEDGDD